MLYPEQQVSSFESSTLLKELGVPQEGAMFYWLHYDHTTQLIFTGGHFIEIMNGRSYTAAFTIPEIAVKLPFARFEVGHWSDGLYELRYLKTDSETTYKSRLHKKLVEAYVDVFSHLLTNKKIHL